MPFNVNLFAGDNDGTVVGSPSQSDSKGQEHPITFLSRKLNVMQQKWPIVEKEAYAGVGSFNRSRVFVFGTEIHMWCDHNPLSYLAMSAPNTAKLLQNLRWVLALQNFGVKLHYQLGRPAATAGPVFPDLYHYQVTTMLGEMVVSQSRHTNDMACLLYVV